MNQKIIQITAGRGPAECCWVVAQVLKYFLDDIRQTRITYSIIQRVKGIENGTLQSATLKLQGDQVNALVSSWLGTVQWIGTSTFRKYHKRKKLVYRDLRTRSYTHRENNRKRYYISNDAKFGPGRSACK